MFRISSRRKGHRLRPPTCPKEAENRPATTARCFFLLIFRHMIRTRYVYTIVIYFILFYLFFFFLFPPITKGKLLQHSRRLEQWFEQLVLLLQQQRKLLLQERQRLDLLQQWPWVLSIHFSFRLHLPILREKVDMRGNNGQSNNMRRVLETWRLIRRVLLTESGEDVEDVVRVVRACVLMAACAIVATRHHGIVVRT